MTLADYLKNLAKQNFYGECHLVSSAIKGIPGPPDTVLYRKIAALSFM